MPSKTSTPEQLPERREHPTRRLLAALSLAGVSLAAASLATVLLPALGLEHAAAAAPAKPGENGASHRPCPSGVPAAIDPPANVTLAAGVAASGVQIYACAAAKPGDAPAWTLEGPHATLSDGDQVVGIHFAGPSWQALDGSSVKGAKLASADAPVTSAVPWLLLSGTATGDGTFGRVTHVQRLETIGGKAPSVGCDPSHINAKVLVPYTSSYFFYRPAAPGEKIVQCRSAAPRKAG
jgi:hypothetical protein